MTAVPSSTTSPLRSPASPVRVYRAALADSRAKYVLLALVLWILAHVAAGISNHVVNSLLRATSQSRIAPPDAAVWISPTDLQIGVRALETPTGSFLTSAAWQIGAIFLILAAVVIVLTQRLRIISLLFPAVLFSLASVLQCIAYNVYHTYWVQGNPLFTLALAGACFGVTWRLAPRNSGWRELRSMARDLFRETGRSPLAQVFGPIFSKEVRVLGRRRGTYWIRALYPLGLLALITLVYFSATADINQFSAGAERIQRLQEIAPTIALFIAWAQYLMLLFLAAALTSTAICDERRTRTLASLMTTPMSAAQIIMGKLTSRLVQLLIIGLISIPFLLGIRVFGGLEAEVIIALVAITISSTFLMAALGILASVWSRKPASAIAFAIMLFLLVTVAPAVVVIVWAVRARGGPPMEIFAFSSPLAMMAATMTITGGGGPQFDLQELWIANSVINVCLGMGAVFIAAVSMRGVMLSETALDAPARKPKRKSRRVAAAVPVAAPADAPAPAVGDTPPTSPPAVEPEGREVLVDRDTVVSDQPVLWRELRQPAVGSRRMMITAACIVAALILWLYTEVGPQREQPHMIVGIIGMLLITIQASVASTPTITNEKDSSTWTTLLATPLTAMQILLPKLIGSVKKLWFIAAVIGAELAIGTLAGRVNPIVFLHLIMIIISVGVFLGGTGILFSLIARRSSAAGLFNMMLAGALWIGVPILGALTTEFVLRPSMGRVRLLDDATFVINPVAMGVVALNGAVDSRSQWRADMPSGSDLNVFEYTALLSVISLIGCAIGLGAIWFACRRFNRLSGRTS